MMAITNSETTSDRDLISDNSSEEEPSYEDVKITITGLSTHQSIIRRLFNSDRRRFKKFIYSTTTHGVVHIFSGKSKIRRFLWLVLVLTAATVCLYSISKFIDRLAQGYTGTTVSILEPDSVDFPAVTLCNMNFMKQSYLEKMSPVLRKVIKNADFLYKNHQECNKAVNDNTVPLNHSFLNLLWNGRHTAEETIFRCKFNGQRCTYSNFTPTLVSSGGVCYTFNRGKGSPILTTKGSGTRFALTLITNVLQYEYSATLNQDAGIKVAVHPQDEPPQPDELGIAISPGKNAFISLKRLNIVDKSSKRKCRDLKGTTSFNFLQDDYMYSVSACQIDCLMTNIAQKCKCLAPASYNSQESFSESHFHGLHKCTIKDICCQVRQTDHTYDCDCPVACNRTIYIAETTYSAFPANYAVKSLSEQVKKKQHGDNVSMSIDESFLQENLLGVNVYFETLTVEEQITQDSYDTIAMLSYIGAQLALFLGVSVISVFEFLAWIFDEAKDRCFGISERKIIRKIKPGVTKIIKGKKPEVTQGHSGAEDGTDEQLQGIDYTKL